MTAGEHVQQPSKFIPLAPEELKRLTSNSVQLSTWSPTSDESSVLATEGSLTLSLKCKTGATAAFVGIYDVAVDLGVLSIAGAHLDSNSKPHRVFALCTHAIPVLEAVGGNEIDECKVTLRSCSNYLKRIERTSPLFSRISHLSHENLSSEDSQKLAGTFSYVNNSNDDLLRRPLYPLTIPRLWVNAFDKLSHTDRGGVPRILVCGAMSTGKSTFCRTLLNRWVTQQAGSTDPKLSNSSTVCYLDIDPGQPDFSPPSQISLVQARAPIFGPSYTHAYPHPNAAWRIIRAHSITATHPKFDTDHFLACVQDLSQRYQDLLSEFPLTPLIINTPGWIHGDGLRVLRFIIESTLLSAVVFLYPETLSSPASDHHLNSTTRKLAKSAKDMLFLPIPHTAPASKSRNKANLRTMQYLSYIHTKPSGAPHRWTEAPIKLQTPLRLPYAGDNPTVLAIIHLNAEKLAPHLWTTVLDEHLLAAVVIEDDELAATIEAAASRTPGEKLPYVNKPTAGVCPPDPRKSRCVALTFVRGINTETCELEVITPSAASLLFVEPRRLVLLAGWFDQPDWAYREIAAWKGREKSARKAKAYEERPDLKGEAELVDKLLKDDGREGVSVGERYLEPAKSRGEGDGEVDVGAVWRRSGTRRFGKRRDG